MSEFCTCGAELPPDALFCHKCGKPQRELPKVEPAPEPAYEPPAAREIPTERPDLLATLEAPVSFRNPLAVRIALGMAGMASLLSWIPFVNLLVWVAAGFFAVYVYSRRTGRRLPMRNGARLGWITGVLAFAILVVLFTLGLLLFRASGGLAAIPQEQLRNMPLNAEALQQMIKVFESPTLIVQMLISTFAFVTLLCTAGGALGAKVLGRR